ncbi:uncharacterized protein LOC144132754 isoform X1 [Amblyomma americanum]
MAETAQRKQKRGPKYCCVVGCHNSADNSRERDPPVKLYRFPGRWYEKERRQSWITAVRRVNPHGTLWQPKQHTRICSRHFVGNSKSDVSQDPSYIPTIFPPVYRKKAPDQERAQRWQARFKKEISSRQLVGGEHPSQSTAVGATMQAPETSLLEDVHRDFNTMDFSNAFLETSTATSLLNMSDSHSLVLVCSARQESHSTGRKRDASCQTEECATSGKLALLLSATNGTEASAQIAHTEMSHKVASTDENWKRNCGFFGFESLKEKEEALQDLCGVTLQVFCLLLNLLPAPQYRRNAMSREDKLCLFLAKLRLGITYSALGAIFGVTATTASTVFRKTLDILSIALKNWVFMPSREIIKLSLPAPFKENYPNCTLIIDCTEVRTETPSNPDCQHMLYSHYKGGYTLKFLIGIIPNGMISFISRVYGGRHTDSFITQDSGFLQLLKPGDLVLSDKGFPSIRTTVEGKGAVLLMPPFNSGVGQLSEQAMEQTYKIASVRIHVERVIQRLKIYHVLSNRIPLSLVPHMNKVVSVCAALVNMQAPIIKK